jgi:hypothetical protein
LICTNDLDAKGTKDQIIYQRRARSADRLLFKPKDRVGFASASPTAGSNGLSGAVSGLSAHFTAGSSQLMHWRSVRPEIVITGTIRFPHFGQRVVRSMEPSRFSPLTSNCNSCSTPGGCRSRHARRGHQHELFPHARHPRRKLAPLQPCRVPLLSNFKPLRVIQTQRLFGVPALLCARRKASVWLVAGFPKLCEKRTHPVSTAG